MRSRYLGRHVRCGGCNVKFRVEPRGGAAAGLPAPVPIPAPTPDPDDPWQGRAEVMRLLDEVAELKSRNAELTAEVERLHAALRESRNQAAPDQGRLAIAFDRETAPFVPLKKDAARVSRG